MPWKEANGVSIHYQLAGERGPVVVLLHELGGTLDSWDAVAPGLSEDFRVLRYDQRGQGLTEKVRREFSNDDSVGDLEASERCCSASLFSQCILLSVGAPRTVRSRSTETPSQPRLL